MRHPRLLISWNSEFRFPNTYLLVGCCNDDTTHKFKGKTVMTESERYESLRHCKYDDSLLLSCPSFPSKFSLPFPEKLFTFRGDF